MTEQRTILPSQEQLRKRRIKRSLIAGGMILVLCAVLGVFFLFEMPSGERFRYASASVLPLAQGDNHLLVDCYGEQIEIEGQFLEWLQSADGTISFFLMVKHDQPDVRFVCDTRGNVIASNVLFASVSDDGKRLFLTRRREDTARSEQTDAFLWENGVETDLGTMLYYALSPDLRSVLYTTEAQGELFLYQNGEVVKVAENAFPRVVSNGAKRIFYSTEPSNLYVKHGANGATEHLSMDDGYCQALDTEHREVLFLGGKGQRYLYSEDGESIKLTGTGNTGRQSQSLVPEGTMRNLVNKSASLPIPQFLVPQGAMSAFDDIEDLYFGVGETVYRIGDQGDVWQVASIVKGTSLAPDGDTLYLIKGGDIYRSLGIKGLRADPFVSDSNLKAELLFGATQNGVFFRTTDDRFFFADRSGQCRLIDDEIGAGAPTLFYQASWLYYAKGAELYRSDGKTETLVQAFDAEISFMTVHGEAILLTTADRTAEQTVTANYYTKDGKTFVAFSQPD